MLARRRRLELQEVELPWVVPRRGPALERILRRSADSAEPGGYAG